MIPKQRSSARTWRGPNAGLQGLADSELLALYGKLLDELRARDIVRSFNNPVADYAEVLFCRSFGWNRVGKTEKWFDAVSKDGTRVQIKGRRLTDRNASRQLGAIRALDKGSFDLLGGVLFRHDFSVLRAALVPQPLVLSNAKYGAWTNSWRFLLRDQVWGWEGVQDVTQALRRANGEP